MGKKSNSEGKSETGTFTSLFKKLTGRPDDEGESSESSDNPSHPAGEASSGSTPSKKKLKEKTIRGSEKITKKPQPIKIEDQKKNDSPPAKEGPKKKQEQRDRTRILPETKDYLKSKKDEEKRLKEVQENKIVKKASSKDETEFFEIQEAKSELVRDFKFRKDQLEIERQEFENRNNQDVDGPQTVVEEPVKTPKDKRRKLFILLGALVVIWMSLDSDDGEKPVSFIEPEVAPLEFSAKENKKKAQSAYEEGKELFEKGGYQNWVQAHRKFQRSIFHLFRKNPAFSYYLLTGVRIQKHCLREELCKQNSSILYQGFTYQKGFELRGAIIALAKAEFFLLENRPESALFLIDRFLEINQPTLNLVATKLITLSRLGQLNAAQKVYQTLRNQKERTWLVHLAFIRYLSARQNLVDAFMEAKDAARIFPQHLVFPVEKIKLAIKDKSPEILTAVIEKMQKAKFNSSRFFKAYTDLARGMLFFQKEQFADGLELVSSAHASLKLESIDTLFSDLELSGNEELDKIIRKSKARKLLQKASTYLELGLTRKAFSESLKSLDVAPDYLPGQLFLARVQAEQGYYGDSIESLELLSARYPNDLQVQSLLIETYLKSRKYPEAKKSIQKLDGSQLSSGWEFAFLKGRYFEEYNAFLPALRWYRKSAKRAPFRPAPYARIAHLSARFNQYQTAQEAILEALELEPGEMSHHALFAKALYELESGQAAIGYIKKKLEIAPEDIHLLSQLAISYYRSGLIEEFKEVKRNLEQVHGESPLLLEFLYRIALIQEEYETAVEMVEKILEYSPGRLDLAMTAGEILLESNKKEKALEFFKFVKDRQPSYPKLYYSIAKIYYQSGVLPKALEKANQEIQNNPESEYGHVIKAKILVAQQELIKAERSLKTAFGINPKSIDALLVMADIQMKRHRYDAAIEMYLKAKKAKPDDSGLLKKLGDAYRLMGQGTLAVEVYKQYLRTSPSQKQRKQIERYIKVLQ